MSSPPGRSWAFREQGHSLKYCKAKANYMNNRGKTSRRI